MVETAFPRPIFIPGTEKRLHLRFGEDGFVSMYKPRRKHPSRWGSKAWHVPQISGSDGNAFWGFSSMGQKPIQGLFLLVVEVYVKRGCARSRARSCAVGKRHPLLANSRFAKQRWLNPVPKCLCGQNLTCQLHACECVWVECVGTISSG